jgi:hypothetical protein
MRSSKEDALKKVEVVWTRMPSPEAILDAQLILLGWTPEERWRALEADRSSARKGSEK